MIADHIYDKAIGLVGASCEQCSEIFFPVPKACARCACEKLNRVGLGTTGKIWSWTVQRLIPKPPFNSGESRETFRPYGVAIIELESGLKVKSRLRFSGALPVIGQSVVLEIVQLRASDEGAAGMVEFVAQEG